MADPTTEPTIPPVAPKTLLGKLLTWSETHTAVAVPIATFAAGFVLGKML